MQGVRRIAEGLLVLLLAAGCGGEPKPEEAVLALIEAFSDSSYQRAWDLLAPDTRSWYDSAAAGLHELGWSEVEGSIDAITGPITEEEFEGLDGRDLFRRIALASDPPADPDLEIESVEYVSPEQARVVTGSGDRAVEFYVVLVNGRWLVDLNRL